MKSVLERRSTAPALHEGVREKDTPRLTRRRILGLALHYSRAGDAESGRHAGAGGAAARCRAARAGGARARRVRQAAVAAARCDRDAAEPALAPFDRHRCIFVHIPKCAGMSVAQSLFGRYVTGHMPLRTYRYIYSSRELSAYYKFTFVRNPYDRLVSAFHFMQQGGMHETDRRWASEHVQGYRDFEAFVLHGLPRPEVRRYFHFTPQLDFVTLPRHRGPQVDFIGRF